MAKRYLAKTGFNYGTNDTRVEAGETVSGLPADVERSLLKMDAIEEAPDLRTKEGRDARDEIVEEAATPAEKTTIEGDTKRKAAPKGGKR